MDEASYCVFLPEALHYDMPFLMSGMSFQDIFYRLLSLHRQVQDRRLQDSADTPVPETECCDYNIAEQPYDNLLPANDSSGEVLHQKSVPSSRCCGYIPEAAYCFLPLQRYARTVEEYPMLYQRQVPRDL